MKNKTTRFLIVSLCMVAVLCVIVFSVLAVVMSRSSADTISEVGTLYMTGVSERVTMHFETIIDYRLSQAEGLIRDYPAGSGNTEDLRHRLADAATTQDMPHLALYSAGGEFDVICGGPLQVTDPEPFMASMREGEEKVAVGTNAEGQNIVLLGVPADYEMQDGTRSVALVAGISVDYFKDILALDEEEALMYSHVIRRDGSFVIRSGDAYRDNYFDRLSAFFDGEPGGGAVVDGLKAAMAADQPFSAVLEAGERRHLYCVGLPHSEWYLVTVMPYGELDEAVTGLSDRWMVLVFSGCGAILAALLWVFFRYFGLTRQQLREVEEARRAAVEAQQAAEQASRAKGEFLSNMSHDIRTPMNAIVGMTAIATANIDNKEQVRHCLKKITLSSKHLLGLINDVLDMSKIESGKLTLNVDRVSLREVMESMVNIVQPQVKAKRQRFDVSIHDIVAEEVCCDGVRLNQVLLNFLSNAIKFTPDGGKIHVVMFEEDSPKGEEYVRIHIHVRDNGIGMTPEFKEKIFESFTREDSARVHKTEGTGLGMAITKYIIDTMGGVIEVDSELGHGSEFRVTLDLEKVQEREEDMILPEWNMLVVDDDQQLCESTVNALASIGIKADWTLDGESAVAMVTQRHNRRDDYQIILLDWKLPGMDGIETAKKLREELGDDVPILLISAYDWGEIEDEAKAAGITGFISKPLFKSTLFYGLRQFAGLAANTAEERQEGEDRLEGRRILLAEDNDLNWEIAEELLGEAGLTLERAENGQICVDMFQAAPTGRYDAILMDIRMPVMNGYEATRAIRRLDRPDADIPIIAMTADAFSEDIQKALDCGMNAHIAKPIDVREVVRLLGKFIRT